MIEIIFDGKVYIADKGRRYLIPKDIFEEIKNENGKSSIDKNLCSECSYYSGKFKPRGTPGIFVRGCSYTNNSLEYTLDAIFDKEGIVKAIATPCYFHDLEIKKIIESGKIDGFETGRTRHFPKIKDYVYQANLLNFMKNFLNRLFGQK